MPEIILCLLLLACSSGMAQAAATNSASRVLILKNSTTPLPTAEATLIIGPLTRTNDVYAGDFKVNVFPYFFKSDRGLLAINVSDKVLVAINQGKAAVVTGTLTSRRPKTKSSDVCSRCSWILRGTTTGWRNSRWT